MEPELSPAIHIARKKAEQLYDEAVARLHYYRQLFLLGAFFLARSLARSLTLALSNFFSGFFLSTKRTHRA